MVDVPPIPPPIASRSTQPAGGFSPTPEHLAQIAAARSASAKIRRATNVALTGGWVTGTFAAITIVSSLTSPVALALGVGMAFVSYFEFHGAGELKRLEPRAPKRLALNQIAFGVLLFLYSAISL